MTNQEREAMVMELAKHPLKADDTFRFRCLQCGGCCRDREDILLSPFDLCRMASGLNKPLPEIISEFGSLYIGYSSKLPLVSLKMREDNGKCPFLGDDNRCSIHTGKPSVCALFPLGRMGKWDMEEGKSEISYILQPTNCGARDETHTPREWMGGFGLEQSEEWFFVWQEEMVRLSEHIRRVFPRLPAKLYHLLQSGITDILYFRYHPEKPVIPQVRENVQHAHKILEMVEKDIDHYVNEGR